MTDISLKLSAYLDGELDVAEAAAIETRLAADPEAQAELDALISAHAAAQEQYDAELSHPVPLTLAKKIKAARPTSGPRPSRPIWGTLAASLVVFMIGGVGGYLLKDQTAPPRTTGWLSDIADYHGVYASQTRHLVEVGANEAQHIETWLGKTVGVSFTIPDLSGFDLTFEGARLLVANGKPVAQLMYRQGDGTVIALCLQRSGAPTAGAPTFTDRTINNFDFVTWSAGNADYVVIGPRGLPGLKAMASEASLAL
ncbi:anti-sigma factor [Roseobacter sp. YSTF-M11]|uniref:Anti-sigma factor n=1 Tax=Roseobacter insulae TaxID=2859783 RepID=A0A9X1K340_9RHOB|nr:anti-sigma factor [Roseobacter insulae]MBW4709183.1 anti-sigma factor [Roseobacter insulae]